MSESNAPPSPESPDPGDAPTPAPAPKPVEAPAAARLGRRPRVMIVEDVATTRTLLRRILVGAGYDVIEIETAEQAIKTYRDEKPDAVTMDVFLDKISGVGALQVILRIDPDARVVMCSSQHDSGFIQETKKLGAKAYLRKPFEPQTVRDAIAEALG
jgi:two-component system, chemotaxis family, chemotaxis protein CheY